MSEGALEEPMIDEQGRPEPPFAGSEAETLLGFLEYQRATFAWKVEGLDAAGLATVLPPSAMTLGGMIKHLAYVEDIWLHIRQLGADRPAPWDTVDWGADPDWEWHSAAQDTPEELLALWHASLERSRAATATVMAEAGLGALAKFSFADGNTPNLRWILTHLLEEYARHNGHADLIRESIDGSVGE
ncbi:DinB family protein [Kineosporia babensis]|uniref:DinB family protein n=1 Tax=Kineosporia babensis TaxID=499548 RepID=A0A9X1NKQ0_9ACTN|nr:DinB family protein [Kineosporia babensis]MCD5316727.1 DinB family protein [Kineosporia babensis]